MQMKARKPGILFDSKLCVSQPCALTSKYQATNV